MSDVYVALLRGINVGGRNRILMADLLAAFEAAGHEDVRTYIQSGNVVFRSPQTDRAALIDELETMLANGFGYDATVEVRDRDEMRAVVDRAPSGFGGEPDRFRYDVLYLLRPLLPQAALDALSVKDGVDTAATGPGVVYFSRRIERAAQSGLSRIVSHPVYRRLTIRNWNTTTKLLAMMEEA